MTKHSILASALALLLSATAAWAQGNAIKVEPANWWTGMKNPQVQLMLHSPNIGKMQPKVSGKGVTMGEVIKTNNPNYLFVTLNIGAKAAAGNVKIELTGADGAKESVDFPLLERRKDSAKRQGFTSDDAIYLLMPDRFSNADPSNDTQSGMKEKADRNEPYGRHGGDLQGVINHLDYIKDLGMTALWMTPVMENDMPQSSYHGYAITNYYEIDRRYGTLDDFKRLSAELHKRGMKHIMDMVFNHCGTGYWWMDDLPCRDWLNKWTDDEGKETFVRSSYRLSVIRDIHAPASDLKNALEGWFDSSMADMNLNNKLVRNYMIQNSIWWIEMADLDGIRQDTYPYTEPAAMEEWCDRVLAEYPNFNIVGECWISDAAKLAAWQKGFGRAHGIQDSGLPTIMDFPLQEAMCRAMSEGEGWSDGANRIYDSFANDYIYPDPTNIMIFGENHDTGRLLTSLRHDNTALKLATALLATARGIPQLYYGTEVLMKGNGGEGHANIRRDFPGGWEGDKVNLFTSRTGAEADMYDYTARLFQFRQKSQALRRGQMTHYLPQGNVYVFFRTDMLSGEKVMVVLNLAQEERTLDVKRFVDITKSGIHGTDIVSGATIDANDKLTVGAREAMVISMK
ncbi:MAG: glycoside hydrolase family 13 protein [Bacteroidales bacterium]|nr:glycoside hydrolase family 13 protein [Bacteroidales bacterium]